MMKELSRRMMIKLSVGTLVFAPTVQLSSPEKGREWTASDGTRHQVSPGHSKEISKAWGESWPTVNEADRERWFLAELSQHRRLTHKEVWKVRTADYICNMDCAWRYMQSRDYRTMFQYVDQIHGNKWVARCGCQLSILFDHHLRAQPQKLVLFPHYPHYVCDEHMVLHNDWEEHFATVYNRQVLTDAATGKRVA